MSHRNWQTASGPSGSLSLDETGLRTQFDAGAFQRGSDYQRQGKVRALSLKRDDGMPKLIASVRGSGAKSYWVEVDLTPSKRGLVCEGFCSCPVTVDCKHVVAALLQGLRQGLFDAPAKVSPAPLHTSAAVAAATAPDPLAGPLGAWLDRLSAATKPPMAASAAVAQPGGSAPAQEALLYCFAIQHYPNGPDRMALTVNAARPLKAGGWGAGRPLTLHAVAQSSARYVTDADRAIARVLVAEQPGYGAGGPLSGSPDSLEWAMEKIIATGRAHWVSKDGVKLVRGPDRAGELIWKLNDLGKQFPSFAPSGEGLVALPGPSPWVVDPATGACGRLMLPLPAEMLKLVLDAPAIAPDSAEALADALARRFPGLPMPPPRTDVTLTTDTSPPIPVLRLASRKLPAVPYWGRGTSASEEWVDGAQLLFDYGGIEIAAGTPPADLRTVTGNRVAVRKRRPDLEQQAAARLAGLGLTRPHIHGVTRGLDSGALSFPMTQDPKAYGRSIPEDPYQPVDKIGRDLIPVIGLGRRAAGGTWTATGTAGRYAGIVVGHAAATGARLL